MPLSYASYAGNGSTTSFSVPFPYILKAHVKAYIGLNILTGAFTSELVDGTGFTWASSSQIQCSTAPTAGQTLTIIRQTPSGTRIVDWNDGSNLIAADMDTADLQGLFVVQEQQDRNDLAAQAALASTAASNAATAAVNQAILVDGTRAMTANLSLGNNKITNLATPTGAADAVTKAYTDGFVSQTVNLADGAVTSAKIADGTIVAGDLAANAVTTAKIADANVTTAKIADGNVTTAKVADAAVTTAKVADGAITSAKIADGTIVAGDIAADAVVTSKVLDANITTPKIADGNVTTAKIADSGVTTAKVVDGGITTAKIADANVTTPKIADANVTTAKIADGNVTTAKVADQAITAAKIADGVIDSSKLTGAMVVTNAEVAGATTNDTSFFTTSASDLRYFRQDSSETINSGMAWSSSDSFVATTAAVDARIIDLVDDVGGFVPIANETSFPAVNPDINNPDGSGTIISIKEIVATRTPASGVVTIANGSGANTVTITGCGSTVLAAGFGVLVETTSTLHTYAFHRLVPKATEVTTVAGISADVATVSANSGNVTAVAGNAANINAVAANAANINAVSGNSANINAVAGNSANINAAAGNAANINTVASNIANVSSVGGSIANVNSVAGNLNTVNDFAARYRVSANDPTANNDVGDLVFNTTNNELRVFNGTAWQGGVTATGNLVSKSGDTFTGPAGIPAGTAATPGLFVSGDPDTGLTSPGPNQLDVVTGGVARITFGATGDVNVPGALTKGGSNVVTVGDTGTVTSAMIADGTIVNGDISATAAIDKTKISGTAITAADNGTVTSAMIADGAIVNADINASAAIAHSKLASIAAGSLLMGDAMGVPTATAFTGDVTISSAGVTTISAGAVVTADLADQSVTSAKIADGTIVNADINAAAAIAASKISGTAITAADIGTVTSTMIADGTIVNGDISASAGIAVSKLAASTISGVTLGGSLSNVTFNNGGAGGASGSTFNGSGALTVSYNTVGAPSTTGANASGTWGINVSGTAASLSGYGNPATSATANTIAYRDANGYLFASFFNQSSANNENPTISQILVTNGSDGYLRKASIAHLTNNVQNNASGTWSINVTGSSGSCSGNAATATQLSTASGSAPSYSARAWVNFNGTGAVAIRAHGNVSSITDNGTGDYTVNFVTAMPDANYSALASPSGQYTVNYGGQTGMFSTSSYTESVPATGSARVTFSNYSSGTFDPKYVNFAVFR